MSILKRVIFVGLLMFAGGPESYTIGDMLWSALAAPAEVVKTAVRVPYRSVRWALGYTDQAAEVLGIQDGESRADDEQSPTVLEVLTAENTALACVQYDVFSLPAGNTHKGRVPSPLPDLSPSAPAPSRSRSNSRDAVMSSPSDSSTSGDLEMGMAAPAPAVLSGRAPTGEQDILLCIAALCVAQQACVDSQDAAYYQEHIAHDLLPALLENPRLSVREAKNKFQWLKSLTDATEIVSYCKTLALQITQKPLARWTDVLPAKQACELWDAVYAAVCSQGQIKATDAWVKLLVVQFTTQLTVAKASSQSLAEFKQSFIAAGLLEIASLVEIAASNVLPTKRGKQLAPLRLPGKHNRA
jgi:hypothetical protein